MRQVVIMSERGGSVRFVFVGPHGLRAGWRLAIFSAVLIALVVVLRQVADWTLDHFQITVPDVITPSVIFLQDATAMVAIMLATLLMKRIERRSLAEYGIQVRRPFNRFFWVGIAWGLVSPTAVMGAMWLLHGYSLGGLALHGGDILKYSVEWALACILLGFAEEYVFRGYPLFTLGTGIGFWPAAFLLSLGFGALHYFGKPFERWTDFASTGLLGLFMCLSLRRTGSLSFAIGFHITFDYANIFVFSGPNGGELAVGHLLNASFPGPTWLTGGLLGPEASLLVFPVIAVMFIVFSRTYREDRFPLKAPAQDMARK